MWYQAPPSQYALGEDTIVVNCDLETATLMGDVAFDTLFLLCYGLLVQLGDS